MHGGNVWRGEPPERWQDHSANVRPEGAPRWVRAALDGAMDRLSYYPDPLMRASVTGLAGYLRVPEENVLPTAGGIAAIEHAARVPASRMLLCTPCFEEYEALSRPLGVPIGHISLLTDGGIVSAPVERVRPRLIEGATVWLCNPLNPVGTLFSREAVIELLYAVEAAHGHLVVDEAFIEYCPGSSVADLVPEHEALIVTGSLTKILGIPGVRAGYLCAAPELIRKAKERQLTWSVGCFAEAVFTALPGHVSDIAADADRNTARRETLSSGLTELSAAVYPGRAPFILARFDTEASLIAERLRQRHILVRECTDFHGLDDGHHLRIAVKDETDNERLLRALREVLECAESH